MDTSTHAGPAVPASAVTLLISAQQLPACYLLYRFFKHAISAQPFRKLRISHVHRLGVSYMGRRGAEAAPGRGGGAPPIAPTDEANAAVGPAAGDAAPRAIDQGGEQTRRSPRTRRSWQQHAAPEAAAPLTGDGTAAVAPAGTEAPASDGAVAIRWSRRRARPADIKFRGAFAPNHALTSTPSMPSARWRGCGLPLELASRPAEMACEHPTHWLMDTGSARRSCRRSRQAVVTARCPRREAVADRSRSELDTYATAAAARRRRGPPASMACRCRRRCAGSSTVKELEPRRARQHSAARRARLPPRPRRRRSANSGGRADEAGETAEGAARRRGRNRGARPRRARSLRP